jgi:hypothetical protein
MAGHIRDLALLEVGVDSKLRDCDLGALQFADITLIRAVQSRAMVVQRKAGRPVQFELTEQTQI